MLINNLLMLDFEPVSRHPATVAVSGKFGPRPPRRGGSYESETGFVSGKPGPRPPHDGAITQRENSRSSMKTNHQWTRIGTRTDGPPSTTTGAKMLLHFCPVGVTLSWEEAPRERGRPARTNPPAASAISSTGINRQRRPASASAGPMRFPPAGRSAATSQGN